MLHIHFIGIGGVGMNGLAQLAALSGDPVSGSDRGYDPEAEVFQALENLGIRIFPQDGSGISETTNQVVYSSAIESGNPDLRQAEALGIPLLHRAEFLKQLIGGDDLIAVAGTAGKTTTTGLLGWIFQCLEKDPSVYNGAAVLNWKEHHPTNPSSTSTLPTPSSPTFPKTTTNSTNSTACSTSSSPRVREPPLEGTPLVPPLVGSFSRGLSSLFQCLENTILKMRCAR